MRIFIKFAPTLMDFLLIVLILHISGVGLIYNYEPFFRYEMSNCLLEATLQKIESDCKCTPKFFMTTVTGFEPCEGRQKKCMNAHMADMGEQRNIVDRGENKVLRG